MFRVSKSLMLTKVWIPKRCINCNNILGCFAIFKKNCTQQYSMTLCWDMKCPNKLVFNLCSRLSHVGLCTLGSRASCVWGCWKQDCHAMRQYILLGSLVQWWSITGLLPKYPGNTLDRILCKFKV